MTASETKALDGVRAAVLTSRFDAVVRAMANTLLRTARSGIINTAHDFSCCILTPEPALLAMAQSLPIHVMCGPDVTAGVMVDLHGHQLRHGAAFLHNSPYEGNSHAADHAILVPVLDENGRHRFTVYAKGHQADCGNSLATTYMAAARDVYEEGALIFPMVQVQSDYRDNDDIVRICKARIRAPEQWWGDYLALVGSARIGERKIKELAGEFGWDALDAYATQWFEYSERLMVDAISALPTGAVAVQTRHDPFPGVPDGVPLEVLVEVDATGRMGIDLRNNPDCLPCGLNLTEATAKTAAMIAVFNSLPVEVPYNGGSFRRIDVMLRENCCVGIPRHPASCSVATTGLANRVGGAVQRGLGTLRADIGMADAGFILNPALGVISGTDPRDGRPFVNQLMLGHAGGPASPRHDGWLTIGDHGAGGVVLIDSVEMDELQYPILVSARRVERDAEGAGRRRGAPGTVVEYGPRGCEMTVLFASDGTHFPAQGVADGHPGCVAWQEKVTTDGRTETLPVFAETIIRPGETIRCRTSGGGGFGDPATREPELVARDVAEGWISTDRAASVYAVALAADGRVDVDTTAELRADHGAGV